MVVRALVVEVAAISRRSGCMRSLWVPLILLTTLAPLRPMKGLLIALQYHHKAAEGRLERRTGA